MQQPDQFVALGRAPVRHRIGDQPDAPSLLSVVGGATLVGHLEEVGATISRVGLTSDEAPLGKPGDPTAERGLVEPLLLGEVAGAQGIDATEPSEHEVVGTGQHGIAVVVGRYPAQHGEEPTQLLG